MRVVFAWLLLAGVSGAEPPSPDPEAARLWQQKQSAESEAAAGSVRRRAERQAAALKDHPWAGSYYYGDGLGVNVSLTLSPRAGFVFEWRGCLGLYDRNFGPVLESDDGRLHLQPKLANTHRGFEGIAEELVPIRWGPRHYLIATNAIKDFCNAVNGGGEARTGVHGFFLLRRGDETKPVSGLPSLPDWAPECLLASPIASEITAVGKSETKEDDKYETRTTIVTLGAGRADGVWEGMAFHLLDHQRFVSIEVVSLHPTSATAKASELGEKGKTAPPAVGWRVGTRAD
jgi:hypothetical protein